MHFFAIASSKYFLPNYTSKTTGMHGDALRFRDSRMGYYSYPGVAWCGGTEFPDSYTCNPDSQRFPGYSLIRILPMSDTT
jgi:hypothetical protein